MTMTVRVKGVPYDNFISGSVEIRLDVLCNSFSFVMARSEKDPLPFSVGDACQILVNKTLVLTGFIEYMTVNYSASQHEIVLSGRDNTSDLVDSTIGILSDFQEGPSLKATIDQVIKHIGSSVKVIDESSAIDFNAVNDISAPETGENVFSFLEPLARQRQVLLTSNGEGNVVITQGSSDLILGARIQNTLANNTDNNVISVTAVKDITKRFRTIVSESQGNPNALGETEVVSIDSIVARDGVTEDEQIRKGRQFFLDSGAYSDDDNFNRALWEVNIRRTRGNLYTATLFQHSIDADPNSSIIWEVNKRVKVVDDFVGINGDLLINTIKFKLDTSTGSRTELTLVEPNSYTLVLEEPVIGVD